VICRAACPLPSGPNMLTISSRGCLASPPPTWPTRRPFGSLECPYARTQKEHHAIRLEKRKNAMVQLRRLAGLMGLALANRRKVAMIGSELQWTGDQTRGTIERANELQLLVNQEGRATTGASVQLTWVPCRWSQGSDQQQPSWRTGRGSSDCGC